MCGIAQAQRQWRSCWQCWRGFGSASGSDPVQAAGWRLQPEGLAQHSSSILGQSSTTALHQLCRLFPDDQKVKLWRTANREGLQAIEVVLVKISYLNLLGAMTWLTCPG